MHVFHFIPSSAFLQRWACIIKIAARRASFPFLSIVVFMLPILKQGQSISQDSVLKESDYYRVAIFSNAGKKNPSPAPPEGKTLLLLLFSSVAHSCPTLCQPMDCSTPGLPAHHQLPEFTQTHVNWVSDAIQPSHPLFSLLLLPSIFPSIRVFSSESVLHMRWPKYWSFSFSIQWIFRTDIL